MRRQTFPLHATAMRLGRVLLLLTFASVALAGCFSPWVKVEPETRIYSMQDIPMEQLHTQPERYAGTVFEGEFKFYRIYHDRATADVAARQQVIAGKTHFTARPIDQYLYAVEIQITPRQEDWMRAHGIERQDVIKAQVRFAGIAPGGALAFDLLKIEGVR